MRRLAFIILVPALLLVMAGKASALEQFVLKGGQTYRGSKVIENAKRIIIRTRSGRLVTIIKAEIESRKRVSLLSPPAATPTAPKKPPPPPPIKPAAAAEAPARPARMKNPKVHDASIDVLLRGQDPSGRTFFLKLGEGLFKTVRGA